MRIQEGNNNMNFDADAQTHFDLLTGTFDGQLRYDLNELILGLKADSLWGKICVLCVAHNDETDSLRNLKGAAAGSPDSTKVSTPTFTANEGFLMASGKYIDAGVSESAATLVGQYDSHAIVYDRTFNGASFGVAIGMKKTEHKINILNLTPDRVNPTVSNVALSILQDTPVGFIGISTIAINNRHARLNDTVTSSSSSLSYTQNAVSTIKIGAETDGASPSIEQIAAWGVGGGLTAAELGLYENRIRTYMQRRGADVY